MADVVVAGGSVAGLAAACAFAQQGRRVVVLERGDPPPEGDAAEAGQQWRRPLVPSFAQAHTLTSLGVSVLLEHVPEVIVGALDAGATMIDLTQARPAEPAGSEPGDAQLITLASRRPTLEVVLHRHVRDLPGVEIRHGERVRGLRLNARRTRVTGVVTDQGPLKASLVVDATGRRAAAREWLAGAGIELPPDRTGASGMRIYTRFYRRLGQAATLNRGNAAGVLGDHYASVLHPGDNGTFSVALGILPEDKKLHVLREVGAFTAAGRATPGITDWLAPGMSEPISGVRPITCPPNALRALATMATPPVAGLVAVGDAACVTNPLYGRGVSLALAHSFGIARLLSEGRDKEVTRFGRELLHPWYLLALADDAERIGLWRAAATGTPVPPAGGGLTMRMVARASGNDAVVWRGLLRVLMGLTTPAEVLGDVEFEHRVRAVLTGLGPAVTVPSRPDLLAAVAAGAGTGS